MSATGQALCWSQGLPGEVCQSLLHGTQEYADLHTFLGGNAQLVIRTHKGLSSSPERLGQVF